MVYYIDITRTVPLNGILFDITRTVPLDCNVFCRSPRTEYIRQPLDKQY